MAQGARQSSLFAAEDFSVVYESFAQADFQAYDFDTIRNSMVNYISTNYPENFNDWISSSEFVSLMELMAFLGHNLAFRNDLNSRENYLSTAERRESALRIAEFLNYTPTRNIVANGLLKVDSIKTNQVVYDLDGRSLANVDVQFDDVTDPDTYQNFLTIMNAIFQNSSQFGSPYARFTSNNVKNEIYRTNSASADVTFNFSGNVSGTRATFNIHSVYYNQQLKRIEEKTPNPYGVFDMLYKNDNAGFSSPGTGFFVGFKQGSLEYKDYNIADGIPNLVLDINENNIANGNIWVQTVDEVGQVIKNWTQVDRLFGLNAAFNSINNSVRDIYTVSSRENDQVSVVFSDGNFGNIPRGIIRVWYRTGLNRSYTLVPDSFSSVRFGFDYLAADGNTYRAQMTCSLKEPVNNASRRESIDSIKANAGRFFGTQDRMITADDYTLFPVTVSENIRKIKSVNRVHSGHSRFRDFYDPTATYSDAIQYTDDSYIYKEDITTRQLVSLPTSFNNEQIFQRYIKPILTNPELKNFFYDRHYYGADVETAYNAAQHYTDATSSITYYNTDGSDTNAYRWNLVSKSNNSSTGYITYNSVVQRLGETAYHPLRKLEVNGLVEFITSPYKVGYLTTITVTNGGSGYTSAPTVTITGAGTGATAQANISGGQVISITLLTSGSEYNTATNVTLSGGGGSGATATCTIASADTEWVRVAALTKTGLGEDDSSGRPTGIDVTGRGAVVLSKPVPSGARIKRIIPSWETNLTDEVKTDLLSKLSNNNSFGLRYDASSQTWRIVESSNLTSNSLTLNAATSWSRLYEGDATDTGKDNSWVIRINYTSSYWEILTRKTRYIFGSHTKLRFNNLNFGETFSSETLKPNRDGFKILGINSVASSGVPLGKDYKFSGFGYFVYPDGYTDPHKVRVTLADPDNDGYPNNPAAFKEITRGAQTRLGVVTENGHDFVVWDPNGTTLVDGRANLHAQYSRIADLNQVIDPSSTNIIDTFVLLKSYEQEFKSWATYDGRSYTKPNPPTVNELTNMFTSLETKKAISDQVIYRPVKFKLLFGDLASGELQSRFIVTKTTNATMSDTEIKQQVIKLIQEYFNIDNWDFGETFYFTELAAYIHNNMIGQIAQITISPVATDASKSGLFEIKADSDEMFMPIVATSNIVVNENVLLNPTTVAANTGVSIR